MGTGKETPRQKMISMMYLVLTALLALNVSKQILQGFVMVDESVEKSKTILDENNVKVKKAFEDYVNAGNYEAKPYLLRAIEAQTHIRKVDSYIDSMKVLIEQATEGVAKKDTSQLRFMERLDDFDTPTHLLLGSDETNLITTKYSAVDLKKQLNTLHSNLMQMLDNMQKESKTKLENDDVLAIKQKLLSIKPIDNNRVDDGVKLNWELENFYNMPMAAVVTNLNKIQADMKNLESEFLHVFGAASNKFIFKVNKLQAKVVAPSAYVLSGQAFKADVVLSASSTELTPERMQVLVGASYDTTSKKMTMPGNSIAVADGMGKYETVTNSIGNKDLKGVVVYKNPKGIDEYYPFDFTYMVAPPFTAVAADKMNVFYVGVDNPISVSSAGFAPSDLKVSVSGCGASLQSNASGKFTLKAASAGTCYVTVNAKVNGIYKPQGPPQVFRVKSIPAPVIKVGGKLALSNLDFSKANVASIAGIGVEVPGFEFPLNMVVKSFDFTYYKNGELQTINCTSNVLANNAKLALSQMRVGQRAYFENVKVQSPAGIIAVGMAQIKIK
jgi:gliding motility-associated protein GldM